MAKATDASKEAKKELKAARKAQSKERRGQMWQAFQMQRKEDKALIPLMLLALIASIALFTVLGLIWGGTGLWFMIPTGIALGVMLAFVIFGRRVSKSVYKKAEGQPGAAGWALGNMRGQWRVQQAVAGTTHLDVVHRVIGKPGIILVGEGNPGRVKPLIAQTKKKTARVVGDTPIYEVLVGNDEGQVPLSKLERHIKKLPGNVSRSQMEALEGRLNALASKGQSGAALPKGPMPGGAKMKNMQRTARRRAG